MAAAASPAWASCSSLGFSAASSQHSAPRLLGVALRSDRDGGFDCGCSSSSSSFTDRLHLRAWSCRRGSGEFSLLHVAAGNELAVARKEVRALGQWMGRMGWSDDGEGVGWMAAFMGDGSKHLSSRCLELAFPVLAGAPALVGWAGPALAGALGQPNEVYGEVGALLEVGVQLIYLGLLLLFLGVGTFLVVRQVLVRRELETAAKELQDRVRSGEASSEEYYELGAIFLRKKLYSTANKYLEQAIKKWDGDDQDLAQVYNALGFSLYSDDEVDAALVQYEKAVKLQPGYVKAWNNLGDAYEKKKDYKKALKAYQEALQFDPTNKIALARRDVVKERVKLFQGIPE